MSRVRRPTVARRAALAAGLALSLLGGPALADAAVQARFAAIMDTVFGRGAWRMTGGYRTPEREDELRAQGAMTVRPGGVSRHSLGRPGAPGAYDLVVDGMSPYQAAARLRAAGAPFAKYQPKGAHGSQGPHLHLEPYSFDLLADGPSGVILASAPRASGPSSAWGASGLPVIQEGFRRPSRRAAPAEQTEAQAAAAGDDLTPAEAAFEVLRARATEDDPEAQLQLGGAYARGGAVKRDLAAAQAWLELAAGNPKASAGLRDKARAALADIAGAMGAEQAAQARRLARAEATAVARCAPNEAPAAPGKIIVTTEIPCADDAPTVRLARGGEARLLVVSPADR